jgi:hypothetical protein
MEWEPYNVDGDDYLVAIAAVKAASEELRIPTPLVRWFVGPVPASRGRTAEDDLAGFEQPSGTVGKATKHLRTVWLRNGLDRRDLIDTAAHEVAHIAQFDAGDEDDRRTRERKAERFAERFTDDLLSRPAATKSALIVDDLIERDGRFTARASVPGMRPWTDIGRDLYPAGRPLLVDGVVSLKNQRSGAVEDAEARESELWMKAQLDKNTRYRGYIARLIEQGRMKYGADALASAAQTAGQSFTHWPLVVGTMRPVAR